MSGRLCGSELYSYVFKSLFSPSCPSSSSCLSYLQLVSREDNSGAGRAAALPSRDGLVPGEGEHQLPRRLHPVRQLRRQGGALPHHLPQRQAHHWRGGVLWEPHAAGWGEGLQHLSSCSFSVTHNTLISLSAPISWFAFKSSNSGNWKCSAKPQRD